MAISYVAAGTAAGNNTATLAVPVPAGIANNDILVIVAGQYGINTLTCDNSFTLKAQGWGTGNVGLATQQPSRLSVFWKRTTGTEGTTTLTQGGTAESLGAQMYAFRGVYTTGDPFEVDGGFVGNQMDTLGNLGIFGLTQTNAASLRWQDIVTLTNGAWVLMACSQSDNNTFSVAPGNGNLANKTMRGTTAVTLGTDCAMYLATGDLATAGNIGFQVLVMAADNWTTWTGALRPA